MLHRSKYTSRKVREAQEEVSDSLAEWMSRYEDLAVAGVRSVAVTRKIHLHLERFLKHFIGAYAHDRISACLKRDVATWQRDMIGAGLAPATVNSHLASLSAFTSWVTAQASNTFPAGDPAKGIGELALPPLEPRSLSEEQIRSLKNVCDRLPRFHQLKGRRVQSPEVPGHAHARPWRDRAIVYVLLSTGLRREELVRLDLDQVEPNTPEDLRRARRGRIVRVKGKGKTERTVFLSKDARESLADYLERERAGDVNEGATACFLCATGIPARRLDGRLSPRAINAVLEQIGRWHDAEATDPARRLSPLRPHDLRHTFAVQLAKTTGADAYELQRRLGHRSQRYIERYTNPPEQVAAQYVEDF